MKQENFDSLWWCWRFVCCPYVLVVLWPLEVLEEGWECMNCKEKPALLVMMYWQLCPLLWLEGSKAWWKVSDALQETFWWSVKHCCHILSCAFDPHPAECLTSCLIVSECSCERFLTSSLNAAVPTSCECWVRAGATLSTHGKVGATSCLAACVPGGPGAAGGAWRRM